MTPAELDALENGVRDVTEPGTPISVDRFDLRWLISQARRAERADRRARILALAKEWLQVNHIDADRYGQYLANFLELEFEKIAEAEREACARLIEQIDPESDECRALAKRIRQRGKR